MTTKPNTDTTSAAKPTSNAASSVAPDWERIELDYRAGVKTLRQIADEQGITHGAINKRAKRDGWERDLAAKIQANAEALVSKAAVSTPVSTETKVSERQVVEANAIAINDMRLAVFRPVSQDQSEVRSHGYASHGYSEGYAGALNCCGNPLCWPAEMRCREPVKNRPAVPRCFAARP